MPAKELKKGGKPAQVKGACDVALDENKEWLRQLFSAEGVQVEGVRVKTLGVEHEQRVASAGLKGFGGSRVVNSFVSFGTDTDFILETTGGGTVVVPQRFLNARGGVHQNLFKVGDVVITTGGTCEKKVNIGSRTGQMAVGARGWREVCAWIPAEKVERALKEGRLAPLEEASAAPTEAMVAELAAQKAAAAAAAEAEAAALKALEAKKAAAAAEGDEDLGSWY